MGSEKENKDGGHGIRLPENRWATVLLCVQLADLQPSPLTVNCADWCDFRREGSKPTGMQFSMLSAVES